ncbi:hypothetical protein IG631_11281 [Alternaria alternata]|nr:hypothetical protein IG631_11281 [Alternaria alternata]
MEEIASPLPHSCAHCVDIVLPGSPEKIHISNIGSPGDPFSDLHFYEEDLNRLDLSLADLGIRANAGCNFSQYLKDNIEHKMYKSADPNAIQLYTRQENDGYMIIEPLICLQSLHLQDEVLASKDLSRCFATTGSRGGLLYIYCVLTKTSGKCPAH